MKDLPVVKNIATLLITAAYVLLAGCSDGFIVDKTELQLNNVVYTPEGRPLGITAGAADSMDALPGSTVVINGRLTGTVTNQTVRWQQTSGGAITITNPANPTLTFTAPDTPSVLGFTICAIAGDGVTIVSASGHFLFADGDPLCDSISVNVVDPSTFLFFEVEDTSISTWSAGISALTEASGYSGTGYLSDMLPGGSIDMTIDLAQGGFYGVYFGFRSQYGEKGFRVTIDGVPFVGMLPGTQQFQEFSLGVYNLSAGTHTIQICCEWNYYESDYIKLVPVPQPPTPLAVNPIPVNANATVEAQSLKAYLAATYSPPGGAGPFMMITGQQEHTGVVPLMGESEKIIAGNTDGEAPAISGFDYMDYSQSRVDCGVVTNTSLTEDIIDAQIDLNFIVSMMWHWNAPQSTLVDSGCAADQVNENERWYRGFYSEATTIDLAAVLAAGPGNAVYDALIDDMDTIAAELQKFEDAGVPVLWRPLHESAGNWFWWGNSTPAAYIQLWQLMYDRFTDTHGLNNLLWVWTAEPQNTAWLDFYPGDEYVDIIGVDGYETENSSYAGIWNEMFNVFNGNKLIALTEVGQIPNVEIMHNANVWFAYFVTWSSGGEYGPDNSTNIEATFTSDEVINRDDLPGGIVKAGVGIWDGFEPMVSGGWHAQVDWTTVTGAATLSRDWSADGATSLAAQVNVPSGNVVLQTYPEGGIDATGADSIEVTVNAVNAGAGAQAQIFFKTNDVGEGWNASFAVVNGPTVLTASLDPTAQGLTGPVGMMSGMGVRLESLTVPATDVVFYIDQVKLISGGNEVVIYSFEPEVADGWHGQVSWSTDNLMSTSTEWSASGARSLAFYHDLEAIDTNVVMQAYPEGGIDVRCKTLITVTANTNNVSQAQIFFKTNDVGEGWNASFTNMNGADPAVLTASLVPADQGLTGNATYLSGMGVRFESLTVPAANAEFYIDKVMLTGPSWNGSACDSTVIERTIFDFENTGQWEFQINWTHADGIQLSQDWVGDGNWSLNGTYDMTQGHPDSGDVATDAILQIYPTGGIYLEDGITTLKVKVSASDAGAGVTAHIFTKSAISSWEATAPVAVADGATVELTQDITVHDGWLEGIGIRFNGFDVNATDAKYYIDSIEFE